LQRRSTELTTPSTLLTGEMAREETLTCSWATGDLLLRVLTQPERLQLATNAPRKRQHFSRTKTCSVLTSLRGNKQLSLSILGTALVVTPTSLVTAAAWFPSTAARGPRRSFTTRWDSLIFAPRLPVPAKDSQATNSSMLTVEEKVWGTAASHGSQKKWEKQSDRVTKHKCTKSDDFRRHPRQLALNSSKTLASRAELCRHRRLLALSMA